MREEYADIITHPHHISLVHFPMSSWSRAAQFSEFKALDGLDDQMIETARTTDDLTELDPDKAYKLNMDLARLIELEYSDVRVGVVYFVRDPKKSGGKFVRYNGVFKYFRIDTLKLVFMDGNEIPAGDITEIEFAQN